MSLCPICDQGGRLDINGSGSGQIRSPGLLRTQIGLGESISSLSVPEVGFTELVSFAEEVATTWSQGSRTSGRIDIASDAVHGVARTDSTCACWWLYRPAPSPWDLGSRKPFGPRLSLAHLDSPKHRIWPPPSALVLNDAVLVFPLIGSFALSVNALLLPI